MKLTFQSFDIEKHRNCKYDSVIVRDGPSATSKMVATYCGDHLPAEIVSSGNSLWIQFISDDSKELSGFEASWKLVEKSSLPGM